MDVKIRESYFFLVGSGFSNLSYAEVQISIKLMSRDPS